MKSDFINFQNKLEDADIKKIMSQRQNDFKDSLEGLQLPKCQKSETHMALPLKFVGIKRIKNQILKDPTYNFEAMCEICLSESTDLCNSFELKQFLISTFNSADSQCNTNSFEDLINPSLTALEAAMQQLQNLKFSISTYYDEVKYRVEKLRAKANSYPPLKVRDIIYSMVDCCNNMCEDEKYQNILNELTQLSSRIKINEQPQLDVGIKRGSLNVSLYHILSQKVRSDIYLINQNIQRGYFLLNDIDQTDLNLTNSESLNKYLSQPQELVLRNPHFKEYLIRMERLGQEFHPFNDSSIDYISLFKYETLKTVGGFKFYPQQAPQQHQVLNPSLKPFQIPQQQFNFGEQVNICRINRNPIPNRNESGNVDHAGGKRQPIFGKQNNLFYQSQNQQQKNQSEDSK